jgi:transcriptional antiterminator NusG
MVEAMVTNENSEQAQDVQAPETVEQTTAPAPEVEEVQEPKNEKLKWYVVHTYSGYENRAKKSLEERIRQQDMSGMFGQVLIPTENVMELGKGGQKKTTKRKFFPGYMLVEMELTDETWHVVKGTPKVTGFVGSTTKPPAIPEKEVLRLTKQIDEGTLKPKPRVHFEEGENVRVVDGPFQNFNGVVDGVNEEKSKVRVLVSIFGRATPVELEFLQVEKA